MVKIVNGENLSFKNEAAYNKYMSKLENKYHIVIETRYSGMEIWLSEEGRTTMENKAKEMGLPFDEYLKMGLKDKKDLSLKSQIHNEDGTVRNN